MNKKLLSILICAFAYMHFGYADAPFSSRIQTAIQDVQDAERFIKEEAKKRMEAVRALSDKPNAYFIDTTAQGYEGSLREKWDQCDRHEPLETMSPVCLDAALDRLTHFRKILDTQTTEMPGLVQKCKAIAILIKAMQEERQKIPIDSVIKQLTAEKDAIDVEMEKLGAVTMALNEKRIAAEAEVKKEKCTILLVERYCRLDESELAPEATLKKASDICLDKVLLEYTLMQELIESSEKGMALQLKQIDIEKRLIMALQEKAKQEQMVKK